jgi:hypothetical protein
MTAHAHTHTHTDNKLTVHAMACRLQLRMRNYATPNRRGVCKASESVVAMFKTEKGRFLSHKLDELLIYMHFKFRP